MTGSPSPSLVSLTVLLATGLVALWLARRARLPDVVLFLLIGLVFGPHAANLIRIAPSSPLGQLIVIAGAVFMLYEGGRAMDLAVLRRIWVGLALLSTLGVLVTAALVAVASHLFIGLPWPVAGLAGATLAATDPAVIVPLFLRMRLPARLKQLVIGESACNDATAAVLTVLLLAGLQGQATSAQAALATFGRLALVGAAAGAAVGTAIQLLVAEDRRHRGILSAREEDAVATLVAMLAAYTLASMLGGSGFLAAFVAGVFRGNAARFGLGVPESRRAAHDAFVSLLGAAVRMLVFGVLGASVNTALLGRVGLAGLAVVLVLVLVARPLAVLASLLPDRRARWRWREMLFVSWVRETGVVPAALADLLLGLHAPGAQTIAALTFVAVLLTIGLQAPSTALVARRTGVVR